MAQYLKEDVRRRIADAALREFAAEGYDGAAIASIAARAGISTGNVYRYFDNKQELFETVVPARLTREFRRLLTERIRAAAEIDDLSRPQPGSGWRTAAGRLLEFASEHRLELVVLLGRARGTRYETLRDEVVEELVSSAKSRAPALEARTGRSASAAFALDQVYRNFVDTLVRTLDRFETLEEIRDATATFEAYHLAGLQSLMG